MKVILLENIKRIGSIGEIIEVKRGFARNFLIANKKALYASKENIQEVEKIKTDLSKKDNEKKQEAQKIFEQINKKEFVVKKLNTENNELYGSVKPTEIAKLILEEKKFQSNHQLYNLLMKLKLLESLKSKFHYTLKLMLRLLLMFSPLKLFNNYTISSTGFFLNFY